MKRAIKKEKLWQKISAAFIATLLWGGVPLALPVEAAGQIEEDDTAADPGIQIQGQMLIISKDQWTNRTVELQGMGKDPFTIYGGSKTGSVYNLNINGLNTYVSLYGGYYDGILENNPVDVTGNTINIRDGGAGWLAYDDISKVDTGYTRLNVNDNSGVGNLRLNVIAGHAGLGEASHNTINVYGGAVNGYLIAAETKKSTESTARERLHDNTVNIYGKADLELASVFGAALYDDADRSRSAFMGTNNTLNTYVKDVEVDELGGFNNYNFYLPADIKDQDTVIDVNEISKTDISGSSLLALVPTSPILKPNDTINLIVNKAGITDSAATTYRGVNADTGLPEGESPTARYDIISEKQDESHVVVRLVGKGLKAESKQIPQVRVPALLNQGGDFMAGGGADSAEAAAAAGGGADSMDAAGAQVYTPFFAASGGAMRYTTGSHVDMRGYSMVLGLSKRIESEKRRLLIAPMAEYGRGNYDAYLDGGTHGSGTSQYVGGGIVFRNTQSDGCFYEGSFRAGRVKTDYSSSDFSVGSIPVSEKFQTSAAYYGGHLGVGRNVKLSRNDPYPDRFVYYGKLFYTHTKGDSITLPTGELYNLSGVDSLRLRLGGKYIYNVNEIHKFYLGMAWEHEFDGSSSAESGGFRTDTPRLRGNSGMMEIGWNYEPKGDNRFSVDISAIGWVGRQRGVTGRLGINWLF